MSNVAGCEVRDLSWKLDDDLGILAGGGFYVESLADYGLLGNSSSSTRRQEISVVPSQLPSQQDHASLGLSLSLSRLSSF
jgi:hypothetical protein